MIKLQYNFSLLFIIVTLKFSTAFSAISSGSDYELVLSVLPGSGGEWLSGGEYMLRGGCGEGISSDAQNFARDHEYSNRSGFYNPPYFTFQKPLPVYFKNSSIEIIVPANSIDKEVFDIFLNPDVDKSQKKQAITQANKKIAINQGQIASPLFVQELYFLDEESFYYSPLKNKGEISFLISDANNDGNVDGTNPPVRLSSLSGYILDEKSNIWLRLFNNTLDTLEIDSKRVRSDFNVPGIYTVLGVLDTSVKNVYVFPVPFRPNGPNAGNGPNQTGTEEGGITFADIPQTGSIEIYTIDGRLVRKITIPIGLIEPKISWDVRNEAGEKVTSGVYIWRVVSGSNSKTGKLMIIR